MIACNVHVVSACNEGSERAVAFVDIALALAVSPGFESIVFVSLRFACRRL